MKKPNLLFGKLPIILLILILTSCKKDNAITDSGNIVTPGFRLVSIKDVFLKDGSQTLTNIEYSGDKVSKMKIVYQNGSEEYVLDYSVSNKVTANWKRIGYEPSTARIDLIFSNGKLTETLEDKFISKLSYNGSGSIEKIEQYSNGVLDGVSNFLYSSGKLIEENWVKNGTKTIEYTLSYSGENINERTYYRTYEKAKDVFSYSSGKISKIQEKTFSNNLWADFIVYEYRYDSDGNLIEETYTDIENGYNSKTTYSYEKGNGNLRQILACGAFQNYANPYEILFNLYPFPF